MDVSIAKAAPIHYLKVAILPKNKTIFAPIVTKPNWLKIGAKIVFFFGEIATLR